MIRMRLLDYWTRESGHKVKCEEWDAGNQTVKLGRSLALPGPWW